MPKGGSRINSGRKLKLSEKLEVQKRLTKTEDEFINFVRIKNINLKDLLKTLLMSFAILFFTMPANAYTLKAGVEYTVDSARLVAFQDTNLSINKNEFSEFLTDKYYYSSIDFINGKIIEAVGRRVVPFYEKNNKLSFYGIQYHNDKNKKFYYSPTGKLLKYEINTFKGSYPYKTIAYDTKGNLININLVVSDKEAYIFNKDKKLIAHWIGNICYNEKGEVDLTKRP